MRLDLAIQHFSFFQDFTIGQTKLAPELGDSDRIGSFRSLIYADIAQNFLH